MKARIIISPPAHPISTAILLPASKSISNRALIIAALGGFRSDLKGLSDADDTLRLDRLLSARPMVMDCGAGGTTLRFLLAWASVQNGSEHIITGIPRLLQRPHDDLVHALNSIGGSVEKVPEGFRVKGRILRGGQIRMRSPQSSQFVSALLLIAPYTQRGIDLEWIGERTSEPYVKMTGKLLQKFGAEVTFMDERISVAPGRFIADRYFIPPDWSASSFWYEIAALSAGAQIDLIGLFDDELQGDAIAAKLWEPWVFTERTERGSRLRHDRAARSVKDMSFDLKATPDLFQPLAITCAATGATAAFTGLGTLPLKETDRITATAKVLEIFGGKIERNGERYLLMPIALHRYPMEDLPIIDPDGDHRMAMASAPLSLLMGPISMIDPLVVEKSYPNFWEDLQQAGFITRWLEE